MYCSNCGQPTQDPSNYCASCGAQLRTPEGAKSVTQLEDDLAYVIPIGTPIIAVIAGYLGLCSLLVSPLGPFAILTGILGLGMIKKKAQKRGKARCWVGIILGTLSTALLIFVIIMVINS